MKRHLIAVIIAALATTACDKNKTEDSKKPATQVAARVNGGEISVHQINFMLTRLGAIDQARAADAREAVLDGLVDQELAVQQAIEAKLDRNPNVLQVLEATRREVLARAYLEQQAATVASAKPSAEEVKKYYTEHPDLFSDRRIYRLEEITFAATPAQIAALKEQLPALKTSADLSAWFKSQSITPRIGTVVKSAEQVPLELLPRLAAMKDGQTQILEGKGTVTILHLLASKSEPISDAAATPVIEKFLVTQRANDAAKSTLKQLREKAKIEYLGDFAALKSGKATATAPATAPAVTAAEPTVSAVPAAAKQDAMSKGIGGLK